MYYKEPLKSRIYAVVQSVYMYFLEFWYSDCVMLLQSAVYSLHASDGGFASGSRDGTVRLWDSDMHPITTLDIAAMAIGYKGQPVSHNTHTPTF